MSQIMTKMLQKENGSGLVLTLMVLVVLSVLGSALGVVTVGSYRLGDINRDSTSAYYIAEAGANMAYEEMENYVLEAYDGSSISDDFFTAMLSPFGNGNDKSNITYEDVFETQFGNQPKATVHVDLVEETNNADTKKYVIKSTGEISGKKRTVEKIINLSWYKKSLTGGGINLPEKTVIFLTNNLTIGHDSKIIGDIRHKNGKPTMRDRVTHEGEVFKDNNINPSAYLDSLRSLILSSTDTYNLRIENELGINSQSITKTNDAKLEKDLNTKGNITIGDRLEIQGDIIAGGNITITNDAKINGNLIAGGNITVGDRLNINGDINAGGNVTITNDSTMVGLINSQSNITLGERLDITGNILSVGSLTISNQSNINGSIVAGGNMTIGQSKYINGILATNKNMTINNDSKISGILMAVNNITIGDRVELNYSVVDFAKPSDAEKVHKNQLISTQPAIEQ